jgi:hypothetical protein
VLKPIAKRKLALWGRNPAELQRARTLTGLVSPPPEIVMFTAGAFADARPGNQSYVSRTAREKADSAFFIPISATKAQWRNPLAVEDAK